MSLAYDGRSLCEICEDNVSIREGVFEHPRSFPSRMCLSTLGPFLSLNVEYLWVNVLYLSKNRPPFCPQAPQAVGRALGQGLAGQLRIPSLLKPNAVSFVSVGDGSVNHAQVCPFPPPSSLSLLIPDQLPSFGFMLSTLCKCTQSIFFHLPDCATWPVQVFSKDLRQIFTIVRGTPFMRGYVSVK